MNGNDNQGTDQSVYRNETSAIAVSEYEGEWISLTQDDDDVITFELVSSVVYHREFRADLERACRLIRRVDPSVVVLTGEPDAFVIDSASAGDDAAEADWELQATFDAVATLEVPVIAALVGDVYGYGVALSLCADIRVGDEGGQYGCVEMYQDSLPAGGLTQRLTATVGQARAQEFLLSGGPYDAPTMGNWGLLNYVHPAEDVVESAHSLATEFADRPTVAYECMKRALRAAAPASEPEFGFGVIDPASMQPSTLLSGDNDLA